MGRGDLDGRRAVARHARGVRKDSQTLVLDHYLEVLARKPGALAGATALAQARESGVFSAAHDAFWATARKAHGDVGGTRALVEVLLLHRHLPAVDVVAGLTAALAVGAATADVVAVEARKANDTRRAPEAHGADLPAAEPVDPDERAGRVVSLTERRLIEPTGVLAGLPPDRRPPPSVDHYDQLLRRRKPKPPDDPTADAVGNPTTR